VLNARDVTERNRAEAERESLFAQEKLANERLRELDTLKDEFVALASHELRTPLTSINGYLELLLEGPLTDDQRSFGDIISRNTQRLLVLINDLLFIAAIEAGQLTVEHDQVELSLIVEQAVSAALPAAQGAQVDLRCDQLPLLTLTGDASRLGQLLDNLISNAIKFTPAGGRVDVVLGGDRSHAWLEVRDTGIGISKADQEQLFNKFFRTKEATQAGIQGTGLGLVISKAIVQAHGGTIQVQSDQEAGTVFRVELPLRLPSPDASSGASQTVLTQPPAQR
jgi:signal transduction histidine kinase